MPNTHIDTYPNESKKKASSDRFPLSFAPRPSLPHLAAILKRTNAPGTNCVRPTTNQ
ncbi:hypothetical protein WAI453_012316 [Rhynchosporium graminicola]